MIGLKDCPDSQVNPIQIPEFPADFSGFSCVKSVRLTEEELPPILRKNFVPTFWTIKLVWEDFWPVEKTTKNSDLHFDSDPKNESDSNPKNDSDSSPRECSDSELKNIPNPIAKAKSTKSKTVSDSKTNSIKDVSDSLNSQKKTNPIKDVSKSTKSPNKTADLTNPIKDVSKSTKSPNKTDDLTNPITDVSKSTRSLNKTDDLTNPIKDFSKSTKSPNKTADLKDDGTWFMDMCFMAAFRNHFIQPELANTFFK